MKVKFMFSAVLFGAVVLSSCKKDECHDCHYDINNSMVELGLKCNDDLKSAEKNGIVIDGQKYDIHCHEH